MTPITLRLREIREAKGMTQAELAEAAGVRRATVSDIETEKTRRVDLETLEKLAVALGVNAALLIVHEREQVPPDLGRGPWTMERRQDGSWRLWSPSHASHRRFDSESEAIDEARRRNAAWAAKNPDDS